MFDSILNHFASVRSTAGASADRRGPEPREAVALAAELERDGGRVPIEVGNISASGLMAYVEGGTVAPDSTLAVWVAGRRVQGQVRWSHNGSFGMRFDAPIELDRALIERYRPVKVEQAKKMSRWMI